MSKLDFVLEKGAEGELKSRECKKYSYKIYKGIMMEKLVQTGECIIKDICYDRHIDCDIYEIQDVDTKNLFRCNKFAIELIEI